MFISLKRIIRTAWINLWRQGSLTFATLFITILTIFLLTSLFLFYLSTQFIIAELKERADISVYFKEEFPPEDIFKIKDEISKIPEVRSINYVSREEALEKFIKKHQDDSRLMEALTEVGGNPFLAALNIKVWKEGQYGRIINFFEQPSLKAAVEKIDYYQRKAIIEKIFSITNTINNIVIILILIFTLIALSTAFNTIRLAIINYSEEIRIQRLVGAPNWFIRGPFLTQGLIVGVFSALFTLLITFSLSYFISPKIANLISGLNIFDYFINNFWMIILLQFATGIGVGIISSLIAIRKYLKT